MKSARSVVLGIVAIGALSACGGPGDKQRSSSLPIEQTSSQHAHVAQTVVRGKDVAPEVRAAAMRGDLAAFTAVTNASRPDALPSGTRLYRISTPGACGASGAVVVSCYAIVPVLRGKTAPVDVNRAIATYLVP
jgi:class 3 adenylate cyclase